MKLDTLVGMAKETAAFGVHPSGEYIYSFYTEQLQAFAKLIAQHERERIFGELLKMHEIASSKHNYYLHAVVTIRARGQA